MTGKEKDWADKILEEVETKESRVNDSYDNTRDYGIETSPESALHYAQNVINTIAWHF